jgi:hypothetical protein
VLAVKFLPISMFTGVADVLYVSLLKPGVVVALADRQTAITRGLSLCKIN